MKRIIIEEITGRVFPTKNEGPATLLEYVSSAKVRVQFEDGSEVWCQYGALRAGTIKNPFRPTAYGVGYLGIGEYRMNSHFGNVWRGIMRRCYDKEFQDSTSPSYRGCTVHEDWHNFQTFAEDFNKLTQGRAWWEIDKDILVKGNKVYSLNTCLGLPAELNTLFVGNKARRGKYPIGVCLYKRDGTYTAAVSGLWQKGVCRLGYFATPEIAFAAYKTAKEARVKELANKWKAQLSSEAYGAIMNYVVEDTD